MLGLTAGRVTHGHRFQGVRDIPIATADAYEEALAAHGQVIASFDSAAPTPSANCAQRPPNRRLAGRRTRRRAAARRSDRAGRVARRVRRRVRARVPGGAAGMPDPDHAHQPEIFPAVRRGRQADQQIPDRQQHAARRSEEHRRRQPARGAAAAGRCALFLRDRTRKPGSKTACRSWPTSSITTSSAPSSSGSSACASSPRKIAGMIGADAHLPSAPPCSPRPIWSPTWSASSRSCRASWAATTRLPTAKTAGRRCDRAALPAALRRRRAARRTDGDLRWRSPTSSKRWPACSASASSPPATRIRLPCGAMRWA